MSGEDPVAPLRRLRDDDRWDDRAFVLRPSRARRRSAPVRAAGAVLFAAAVVAAVVVLVPSGAHREVESGPRVAPPAAGPRTPRIAGDGLRDDPVAPVPWSARPGDGVDLARASGRSAADPGVQVAVRLASRVPAGRPLAYAVVVTNTATSPLHLEPCPQIEQRVTAGGGTTSRLTTLRCDGTDVPPGSAVSFAMRAGLPAAASGTVVVRWRMEGGPVASATTEVEEP